jgi:hypothetical protein
MSKALRHPGRRAGVHVQRPPSPRPQSRGPCQTPFVTPAAEPGSIVNRVDPGYSLREFRDDEDGGCAFRDDVVGGCTIRDDVVGGCAIRDDEVGGCLVRDDVVRAALSGMTALWGGSNLRHAFFQREVDRGEWRPGHARLLHVGSKLRRGFQVEGRTAVTP